MKIWMAVALSSAAWLGSVSVAHAGRGASAASIRAAVAANSPETIVSELERAEKLACLSCVDSVKALIDHSDARVRDAAGWWLGKRGIRKAVVTEMTARLSAEDPVAARNAADVLAGMREVTALPALTTYAAHPLDEESGRRVVRAIGSIGHPSSITALAAAASSATSTMSGVREEALKQVRELRAPVGAKVVSGFAPFSGALTDADERVRREAAYTAGFLGDKAAVASLVTVLTNDSSATVRKAAAWALGELGDGSAREVLDAATRDADSGVRSIATAARRRVQ